MICHRRMFWVFFFVLSFLCEIYDVMRTPIYHTNRFLFQWFYDAQSKFRINNETEIKSSSPIEKSLQIKALIVADARSIPRTDISLPGTRP